MALDNGTLLAVYLTVSGLDLLIVLTLVPRLALKRLQAFMATETGRAQAIGFLSGVLSSEELRRTVVDSFRMGILGKAGVDARAEKGLAGAITTDILGGTQWGWMLEAFPEAKKWIVKHPEASLMLLERFGPGLIKKDPQGRQFADSVRGWVTTKGAPSPFEGSESEAVVPAD